MLNLVTSDILLVSNVTRSVRMTFRQRDGPAPQGSRAVRRPEQRTPDPSWEGRFTQGCAAVANVLNCR